MKLKYYLRGLGIGIAVTAVILCMTNQGKAEQLTDSQIKERAKQLGMVEETLLSDVLDDTEATKDKATNQTEANRDSVSANAIEDKTESTEEHSTEIEETNNTSKSADTKTTNSTADAIKKIAEDTKKATEDNNNIKNTAEESKDAKKQEVSAEDSSKDTKKSTEPEKSNAGKTSKNEDTIEIVVNSGESSVAICKKLQSAGLITSAAEYDWYLCKNGYDKKICTGNHIFKKGATEAEIAKEITTK